MRVAFGHPPEEKAGHPGVILVKKVQQAPEISLHDRRQFVPRGKRRGAGEVQDVEPVLDVDRKDAHGQPRNAHLCGLRTSGHIPTPWAPGGCEGEAKSSVYLWHPKRLLYLFAAPSNFTAEASAWLPELDRLQFAALALAYDLTVPSDYSVLHRASHPTKENLMPVSFMSSSNARSSWFLLNSSK